MRSSSALLAGVAQVAILSLFFASTFALPLAVDLSVLLGTGTIASVKEKLASSATDTWVSGTQMEALLELDYPTLSVYSSSSYPPPSSPVPSPILSIVSSWSTKRSSSASQLAYVDNGAAGDPAALGVGWLVAAAEDGSATYLAQVKSEVDYLLNTVPRTSDGAISHRPAGEAVQLWADNMYMTMPLLAYYGVATANQDLVLTAYTQCALYRSHLFDKSTGLWKHVVLGSWQDNGLWSTGNGWAAAGMLRVAATIQNGPYAEQLASQADDLAKWTASLLVAAFKHIKSDGLLPNYLDSATGSSFSDAAGSALLASAAYRLAALNPGAVPDGLLEDAAVLRKAVNGKIGSNGWLSSVVDPLTWTIQSSQSPEAEAFVLLLQAAWRDYVAASFEQTFSDIAGAVESSM